jgi:hypothetical protein
MTMTTTPAEASIQVPESLQALIDSRLDTIDRMLLGRLPRGERLEIVREVESQIFELLQGRAGGGELMRDDVLDVLRRLDPPEAYLPEDFGAEPVRGAVGRNSMAGPRPRATQRPSSSPAVASGVLGIVAVIGLALQFPVILGLANLFQGNAAPILIVWYILTTIVFVAGVTAITMAAMVRLNRGWAITGLATGIFAVLGSLGFAVLGLFL